MGARYHASLGAHALRRGIYGPGLTYTCRAQADRDPLEAQLDTALSRLPASIFTPSAESTTAEDDADEPIVRAGTAADGATIK